METTTLTPMIRQYLEIKEKHKDSILFFRMGDFYEMFFEDAKVASSILDIALTSRNKNDQNSIPLCGVPYHSASSYIAKLIQAGQRVAICEQVEDPKTAKGIVRRDVTRVVTPGLVLESESLDSKVNNFVASISLASNQIGLSLCDISTGEVHVGFYPDLQAFLSEFTRREAKELLVCEQDLNHFFITQIREQFPSLLIYVHEPVGKMKELLKLFSESFQESFEHLSLKDLSPLAERATLRLLDYVSMTLKSSLKHFLKIAWSEEKSFLTLDAATVRNLELIRSRQEGATWGSLFWALDKTLTPMGARRLKNWILYPLNHLSEIKQRQAGIAEALENVSVLEKTRSLLSQMGDLERQNARISTGLAHARDLLALSCSLKILPQLKESLTCFSASFFKKICSQWESFEEIQFKISSTLKEELPFSLKEGGLIQRGVSADLDELHDLMNGGLKTIAEMEEHERKATQISQLKIRYNRVFGYYIEIPSSKIDKIPAHYQRKQTLANAERFITPELKSFEEKVLSAEERIRGLEYEIFVSLRNEVSLYCSQIAAMALNISECDCLMSLAASALEQNYVAPEWVEGNVLEIEQGRHPVLEKLFPSQRFVPNDLRFGEDQKILMITGPNMAGKSTYLRQSALLTLMAHMGSFVPAAKIRLSLVDRIFTRIGASDNLSKNQSTFWVEMEETAFILKQATEKSLIVLDEIGRGTSTYDGLSIAWAVAEYLHDTLKSKTLFATHYHELIEMQDLKEKIKNFHVAVKEWQGSIIFLYQIRPGGVSQSYGIAVASLAGIPKKVTERAKNILLKLQQKQGSMALFSTPPVSSQTSLFPNQHQSLIDEIAQIKLESLSPLEALNILYDLQKKIKNV